MLSAGGSGGRRGLDASYSQDYDGFEDANQYKARKRARSGMQRQAADFGDESLQPTLSTRAISVSDEKELWDFYEQRFKDCQQTACKLIAKAWIKAVEPKKQSTHPYTGSDEKAPDWWPQPWGTGKDDRVRHKEPDHLYKRGTSTPRAITKHAHASFLTKSSFRTCPSIEPHPEDDRGAEQPAAC